MSDFLKGISIFLSNIIDFFLILWNVTGSCLFRVTTLTLLCVLVAEGYVGMYLIKGDEIKDVCSQIEIKDCNVPSPLLAVFYSIVKYTSQSTIVLMIVTFIYLLINWTFVYLEEKETDKSQPEDFLKEDFAKPLIEVLIGSLSASAIPTGISLIICAFYNINLIKYMLGVEIYIAFAGIAIISIAFLSTMRQQARIGKSKIVLPEEVSKLEKNEKNDFH